MAADYTRVLAAVDFDYDNSAVVDRAAEIARRYRAELTLLHVVEDAAPYQGDGPQIYDAISIQKELTELAAKRMNAVCARVTVLDVRTRIEKGSPKNEIVRVAEDEKADLIVIGSHGRRGLQMLLGSTANGVLHLATCDVLAVRVKDCLGNTDACS
jgi:universal stress protein A